MIAQTSALNPARYSTFASSIATPLAAAHDAPSVTASQDRATLSGAGPTRSTAAPDAAWSKLGRIAAITAGVVGGALVAGAVAQATAGLGLVGGALLTHSLYVEALPQAVSLAMLIGGSQTAVLAASAVGAVVGGLAGSIASGKKEEHIPSPVPGSGLDHSKPAGGTILSLPRWSWSAVKDSVRGAGEQIHDGVNGVSHADSLGAAVKAGAHAGYAFGHCVGGSAGKTAGLIQGAYLGTIMAGMPLTFTPMTAIPVGFIGAWGESNVMQKVGGVTGGAVAGAGGAVAGAVGYGLKKLAEKIHG